MTPNFALNLSEDGISLLHRAAHGAGWVEVGSVALDDPDLGKGLKALRDKAAGIEGTGFSTKLILPPSQLLYATVMVEGDIGADVAAALEERTPYSADELSYDMSGDAPEVKIVAVARDTLAEAEGFIDAYGFNPQGFTAIPDPDHFDGEPNLGGMPSRDGKGFVTDAKSVSIITKAEAEAAVAKAEAKAEADRQAEHKAAESKTVDVAQLDDDEHASTIEAPETLAETDVSSAAPPADLPAAPPAAFSSRRKPSLGPATDAGDMVTSRAPRIAIPTEDRRAAPRAKKPSKVEPRIKTGEAAKPKATPALVPPAAVAEPGPTPGNASERAAGRGLRQTVAAMRSRRTGQKKVDQAAASVAADPIAELAARQAAGKPRFLGLILTGLLILALMLFAALSSFLLPDDALSRWFGSGDTASPQIVENEVVPELPPAPAEIVELDDTDFAAFTVPSPEEIAEAEVPEPEFAPILQMDANEAQTAYAVSGIWQLAPELRVAAAEQTLDDLYDSSLDPSLAFEDAPALASFDAVSQALSFQRPAAPPAAEILFNMDERGLVRPSPEGSLNPDGILVFLGKPPVLAVQRPAGLAPETLEEVETPADQPAIADGASEPDEETPTADPALAGFKPVQRPADLQERFERATQNGLSTNELASIRPLQRPQAAQARAREEAIARALAEAAAEDAIRDQEEAQAAAEAAVDAGTRLAVASSTRPGSRPRNFERVVARAKRAAPEDRNPAAAASTAAVARATGPAVARSSRARPTGTTRASVARAATDNNAISLGKVALVGVFGTSSNRRALVRMPNGRFKKVAVGDRVDGGRVAAIGEGQLKYKKGSRTVTLQMPKG